MLTTLLRFAWALLGAQEDTSRQLQRWIESLEIREDRGTGTGRPGTPRAGL